MIKPAGEIAQQPLGFIGIVELPSLPERPACRSNTVLNPLIGDFINTIDPSRICSATKLPVAEWLA